MGKRLVSSVSEHRLGMDAHVSNIKYAQMNLSPFKKPRAKCKEKSGMDKMKERRGGGKQT